MGSRPENNQVAHHNLVKVAELISRTIHPFFISFLCIGLLIYLETTKPGISLVYALFFALIVLLPQYLLISINVKRGRFSDKDVSNRKQRGVLYLLGIGSMVGYVLIAHVVLEPPRFFYVFILTSIILTTAFFLITKAWTKISIHCGALASLSVFISFYSTGLLILFMTLTLLISWSRYVLSQHTALQIVLSWIIPAAIIPFIFIVLL